MPDLAELAVAAMQALHTVGADFDDLPMQIESVIAERAFPERALGPELAVHEVVVRSALVAIVFEIAQRDHSLMCPTGAMRRALGR